MFFSFNFFFLITLRPPMAEQKISLPKQMKDDMDRFLERFPDASDWYIYPRLKETQGSDLEGVLADYGCLLENERIKLQHLAHRSQQKDDVSMLQLLQPTSDRETLIRSLEECRYSVLDASVNINYQRQRQEREEKGRFFHK